MREPMRHLFCVENIDRCGSNWPLETKMCNFDPKFGYLGPKVNIFVLESQLLSTVHIISTLGATTFPFGPPWIEISVSELWVIFRGSPLFLAVSVNSHFTIINTLNFGPSSMKLVGAVRAIKKMTHNDNGPGQGQNYGETAVFRFGQKLVFWPKVVLHNFSRSWPEHGVP